MRNLRKNTALLGIVVLFVAVSGVSMASVAGRNFSRCINTCNDADQACKAACNDDCHALCNNVTSCVTPCISNCKQTTCVPTMNECKLMCQAIKNGGSPTEP
jgi:hypothetical protein